MKILKELIGYSGSKVLLIQNHESLLVRKIGNIDRNIERFESLKHLNINFPKILSITNNYYDLEYIPHSDMVTWLLHNSIDRYVEWIFCITEELSQNSVECNWSEVYQQRLSVSALETFWHQLIFTKNQLFERLPKILPKSYYHGDFTVENCIFGNDGNFYLIDPITTDYSSWIFDLAKLQQDLVSGWFIRNKPVQIKGKLWDINSAIINKYPIINDQSFLILMLLRVLPYARTIQDQQFLINEINKLWANFI